MVTIFLFVLGIKPFLFIPKQCMRGFNSLLGFFIYPTTLVVISWYLKIGLQIISDMVIVHRQILILYISCMVSFSINTHCEIQLFLQKHFYDEVFILRDNSPIQFKLRHEVNIFLCLSYEFVYDVTFTLEIFSVLIVLRSDLTHVLFIYVLFYSYKNMYKYLFCF